MKGAEMLMKGRFLPIILISGAMTLSLLTPCHAADPMYDTNTGLPSPVPDSITVNAGRLSDYDAVSGSDGSLSNFHRIHVYEQGQFEDVRSDAWFADNVAAAYEYGILLGTGEDRFGVGDTLTIAQAAAIADRLHNQYYGGSGKFVQGQPWYQVYMDYAADYGILSVGQYDPLADATRAQFAEILSAALPDEALPAINQVTELPDVDASEPCISAVLRLYNAGILTGNDDYGTFGPHLSINREQIAAMATRVVDGKLRVPLDLMKYHPWADAYKAFLAQARHEDEWSYTITEFALCDINKDGIPELITHGGGQMDYTKIFTYRGGNVEYVHWGTSFSFYDNGLIGTDFGGGDGYRLYTLYQIGDALQLELVYRYAEWYRSGTTYYTEGEEAYEEGSRQASYETVLSEWNRLIGSAQIEELSFLKNTADSREQITMD